MSGKKKSELMNVYFQNGNQSIGELDTVESHGLILHNNLNGERVARNESHLNKYNQLAPIKTGANGVALGNKQSQLLSKQRSHKQSLNGLSNARQQYLSSLEPNSNGLSIQGKY
jgi:hypothetical protein